MKKTHKTFPSEPKCEERIEAEFFAKKEFSDRLVEAEKNKCSHYWLYFGDKTRQCSACDNKQTQEKNGEWVDNKK